MSADLHADDFPAFLREVHGHDPFPWQCRLAKAVFEAGWPRELDVPTGAGKTAAIDVALFHLALEASRGQDRRAPVRILFVVDRRLIVDEAYERARKIAVALASASGGILQRVADRLRLLAEAPEKPVLVARLRGGAPKEPDWVRTPSQPSVIVSTVDQVGSRMLFRGYGVRETMQPLHAGLLGADALLLLDEAHLSRPFFQTVRDSRMFQEAGVWSEDRACAPFAIVSLSATPTDRSDSKRLLGEDDENHPVLGPRLRRPKPAELVQSEANADDAAFADLLAARAWSLSVCGGGGAQTVAVVVNRVKRARAVFEAVQARGATPLPMSDGDNGETTSSSSRADAALLIGRTREMDRRELLQALLPRIKAGRDGSETTRPTFVIATQCIEAGADLDFDALVTELAPLDCLRQRFGRLNRMGREIEARAVILAGQDQISRTGVPDPIYGQALKHTWDLLHSKSVAEGRGKKARRVLDFSAVASRSWVPSGELLDQCLAPLKDAPVLLPRDVNLWCRTNPSPAVDPEVSLYLHGPQSGPPDVSVLWRSDLDGANPELWMERIAACAPSALEAVSVPIGEARRWLAGTAEGDVPDIEAVPDEPTMEAGQRAALRWFGAKDARTGPVTANELRPGDMIVVSSEWGGCDRWGWAPQSKAYVKDVARAAVREHRGRDVLRLSRASPELGLTDADAVRAFVGELVDLSDAEIARELSAHLVGRDDVDFRPIGRTRVVRGENGVPLAIERRVVPRRAFSEAAAVPGEAVTEDEESVRAPQRPILLSDHCIGVERRAREFARKLGLDVGLMEDVALAARLHDLGKAHPAFKRFLYGGSELAAIGGAALAKSNRLPGSPAEWNGVRERSGLPQGARHELASILCVEADPRFARAHDPELVLWLVGTHHGYGRPFFPPVDWPSRDSDPVEAEIGGVRVAGKPGLSLAELTPKWIELFGRLLARYGPWGLARLEALVRLADHRQSEAEQVEDSQSEVGRESVGVPA